MNLEEHRKKVKSQYDKYDWAKLCANAEFTSAWERGDLTKAEELAATILFGSAKNRTEAKQLKEERRIDKLFEPFTTGDEAT
jgi:hypothetical protein